MDWTTVEQAISRASGAPYTIRRHRAVGGGCINAAWRLEGEDGRRYFVKTNAPAETAMFDAEAAGLEDMARTESVRVPRVVCQGADTQASFLVLEWLDLRGADAAALRRLGAALAEMHRVRQPFFGWHRDNTIGSTPQPNPRAEAWVPFYAEHRLGFQLALAARNGYAALRAKGERLIEHLPVFFADYHPYPSLLHGDLWSGNAAADADGRPVIFDPACYYGDREADIAMTELFGGFGADFLAAYNEVLPLDAGYAVRRTLYNLYHILNHLNLFGGGYRSQAERMLDTLLAELRA
ncbi:fructosamine kinase family protein [Ectothiorhodospiraceae bacterium 2226]|nr:fructosamine kinase family protein [Ectothiorhodospiraceae bacterium 2226]